MKPSFKFQIVMNFVMSFLIGIVMTGAMALKTGTPFKPEILLPQIGVATLIGFVVMLVLPIAMLGNKLALGYGAKMGTPAQGLLQGMVIATAMTFLVSFGMTAFATGFGPMPDGTPFIIRWFGPIPSIWGIAYVATIIFMPLGLWLARKADGASAPQPASEPEKE